MFFILKRDLCEYVLAAGAVVVVVAAGVGLIDVVWLDVVTVVVGVGLVAVSAVDVKPEVVVVVSMERMEVG